MQATSWCADVLLGRARSCDKFADMSEAKERARRRRVEMQVRVLSLGEEVDAPVGGSPSERVAMVWRMTLDAWASAPL